ncbi:MAG: hypothetical protein CUN54_08390, partial [Phototrophicales bacterium]
ISSECGNQWHNDNPRFYAHPFTEFTGAIMPETTLADVFKQTRDRLIAMVNDGFPDVATYAEMAGINLRAVFDYDGMKGVTFPYVEIIFGDIDATRIPHGTSYTVPVTAVLWLGTVGEGFDGTAQQLRDYTIIPALLQYFAEHRRLTFGASIHKDALPFLNVEASNLNGANKSGRNGKWVVAFDFILVFDTPFGRNC